MKYYGMDGWILMLKQLHKEHLITSNIENISTKKINDGKSKYM